MQSPNWDRSQWITQASSIIVLIFTFKEFITSLVGVKRIRDSDFMSKWFSTSNTLGVTNTKRAATRKLNKMMANAHVLHPSADDENDEKANSSDRTMLNFVLKGDSEEKVCTFSWTFKMLFTRKLFDTEGVWIMTRLVVAQVAMFILILVTTLSVYQFIIAAADEADRATEEINQRSDLPQWIYDLVPNGGQVKGALFPALAVMCLVMVLLFILYIPRYVSFHS